MGNILFCFNQIKVFIAFIFKKLIYFKRIKSICGPYKKISPTSFSSVPIYSLT